MSNSDKYKNTFSNIIPSEQSVEKAMDFAKRRRKNFNISCKKTAVAVMALVIVFSGVFAVSRGVNNNKLTVMVAYAYEDDFVKVESGNAQNLFYAIYVAPIDDKEKREETLERFYADSNKVDEEADKLAENGFSTMISHGPVDCFNEKLNKQTVSVHIVMAGSFALSLDDYSNVKSFKVENNSPYGWLHFQDLKMFERFEKQAETDEEYDFTYEETLAWYNIGSEFTLSGDELRESQESGRFAVGSKKEINKGYYLEWQMSDVLRQTLADDPNFDLSQIKDTITFTVEFNDGSVKTASLNLYFDSDGYMHFE